MANVAVSWLLPVKNGMPFIAETLASIAAQTMVRQEVLVWDNGSTDGTQEELRRWIPGRLPGRVIADQPRSLTDSLAGLVNLAQSEFCARIDADDRARPERLTRQLAHLEGHPAAAAVSSAYQAIDVQGRPVSHHYPTGRDYAETQDILLRLNGVLHPAIMFRRSAVLALGNYRWPPPLGEDYDLWLRLCARHELHCLPDILTEYRVHPQSLTATLDSERFFRAVDACWLANADTFAGLSNPQVAADIRARRCPWLLPHLVSIARHLGRRDGIHFTRRFFRREFVASGLFLCAPQDRATRKFLRLCQRFT